MSTLVFDIGGTTIRAGIWSSDRQELVRRSATPAPPPIPNDRAASVEALMTVLSELARKVRGELSAPTQIGIAFPGPVDSRGRVSNAPTLWGEGESGSLDLAELVSSACEILPVTVVNDLTAAGARYAERGSDFCILTVSTGIGNKVFLDGRPILGAGHRGGELGHWRVDPSEDAPLCDCGGRGHLGSLASGRATAGHFRSLALSAPDLFTKSVLATCDADSDALNDDVARAFRKKDPFAVEIVLRGARPLGSAIAALHLAIGLERFIVMGGWAQALGADYLVALREAAGASEWGARSLWENRIEAAIPDDDSGLIGMGRYLDSR